MLRPDELLLFFVLVVFAVSSAVAEACDVDEINPDALLATHRGAQDVSSPFRPGHGDVNNGSKEDDHVLKRGEFADERNVSAVRSLDSERFLSQDGAQKSSFLRSESGSARSALDNLLTSEKVLGRMRELLLEMYCKTPEQFSESLGGLVGELIQEEQIHNAKRNGARADNIISNEIDLNESGYRQVDLLEVEVAGLIIANQQTQRDRKKGHGKRRNEKNARSHTLRELRAEQDPFEETGISLHTDAISNNRVRGNNEEYLSLMPLRSRMSGGAMGDANEEFLHLATARANRASTVARKPRFAPKNKKKHASAVASLERLTRDTVSSRNHAVPAGRALRRPTKQMSK